MPVKESKKSNNVVTIYFLTIPCICKVYNSFKTTQFALLHYHALFFEILQTSNPPYDSWSKYCCVFSNSAA